MKLIVNYLYTRSSSLWHPQLKAQKYPFSVYVSDIPELYFVDLPSATNHTLTFGANLPLAELESICLDLCEASESQTSEKDKNSGHVVDPTHLGPLRAIHTQLRYFAGMQIRNVASVGGNIATASPISDLNPVWVSVGARVGVRFAVSGSEGKGDGEMGSAELGMEDFFCGYRKTRLPEGAVIEKIVVPLNDSEDQEVVRAYKQVHIIFLSFQMM